MSSLIFAQLWRAHASLRIPIWVLLLALWVALLLGVGWMFRDCLAPGG